MTTIYTTLLCLTFAQADAHPLLTVAERSDYRATARYHEVRDFLRLLAESSPRVRLGTLGTSVEGRDIPLVIIAEPPIATADDAKKSDKFVAFAFGGIHAGEICGKEALLMLARDIAATPDHPLLKRLIIVFVPILNVDGNERVSKDNRPGQDGPADGMGIRHNAMGLDLNRDYIKLESPEIRALVRFLSEWDPALIIDTHTTNGSYHQYTLTYDGPRIPAADRDVISYVKDTMLPDVSRTMERVDSFKSYFYGDFDEAHSQWHTYPAKGRYGTHYGGLRNRIAILSEAYAYAPFRDRVLATRAFVRHCLQHVADHHVEVKHLIEAADRRTVDAGSSPRHDDRVSIRHRSVAFPEKVEVAGYVEETRDGVTHATERTRTYEVEFVGRTEPTLSVRRPYAYLLPSSMMAIADKLREHGLYVEKLTRETKLEVEVYTVDRIEHAEREFQGHRLVTVEVTAHVETRRFQSDTYLVRTGQKLGALAVYLLEPQSEDGLCTWNFFDDQLQAGKPFPVVRLLPFSPLPAGPAKR